MYRFVLCLVVLAAGCQSAYQPQVATPPVVAAVDQGPVGEHIHQIDAALDRSIKHADAAIQADSIELLKQHTDAVFREIWGISSDLVESSGGASVHGWKTRWQARFSDFDPAYGARYGSRPPAISEPATLGIVGRGRYIRRYLSSELIPDADESAGEFLIALNNIIGWMKLDDGVTKAERQPRIDLTYRWDAPNEFWLSNADTGWIFEVQAQALNILKSEYSDLALARNHATDLTALIRKCRTGHDADGDGLIAPTEAEAGFDLALKSAAEANLI